jgi:hypothetical protein
MQVYSEFNNFVTNVFNNKTEFKTYFDAYTTFLITMKYNNDDIKNKRMNLLINYYYDNLVDDTSHLVKCDYEKYYETYIVDDLKLEKYHHVSSYFKEEEQEEQQDEDTLLHYRDYFARYDNKNNNINDNVDENEEYFDNDDDSKYSELSEDNTSDIYSSTSLYEYSDDYDEYYDDDN